MVSGNVNGQSRCKLMHVQRPGVEGELVWGRQGRGSLVLQERRGTAGDGLLGLLWVGGSLLAGLEGKEQRRKKRPCPWFLFPEQTEAMPILGLNAVRGVTARWGRSVSKPWIVPNTRLTCLPVIDALGPGGKRLTQSPPLPGERTASTQHATQPARPIQAPSTSSHP